MRIDQERDRSSYTILGYEREAVTIATPAEAGSPPERLTLTDSFLLQPQRLDTDWPPAQFEALRREHLAAVLEQPPEVLLLGTGPVLRFPPPEVFADLYAANIGVEVMDSGAACRTFNILANDGRRVALAVLFE